MSATAQRVLQAHTYYQYPGYVAGRATQLRKGVGEGESGRGKNSPAFSPPRPLARSFLALLWSAALLTQKTFELLCQIVTAHGFCRLSRRRFGLLWRTISPTLQVFDMRRNLWGFGNRPSHPCVKNHRPLPPLQQKP